MDINYETITVQDCIEMLEMKNQTTVINDGNVIGFEMGNAPEK